MTTPDRDQASNGDLAAIMRDVLDRWLRNEVDDCLPARVVSYNRDTGIATIQPLVQVVTTDGARISRPNIPGIKVFRFGGGGFFIDFPLKPGDFGWLKANDRDISLILQAEGGEDQPNTKRLHSFSDALFFPDTVKDWIIDGGNSEGVVMQAVDGSQSIAINPDSIDIKAKDLNIEAENFTAVISDQASITAQLIVLISDALTHNSINVGGDHAHGGSATAPDGPVTNTGTPV